ncbi:methyltransferase-like protein 27 isoform 2-T2 [Vipera latastei]
MGGKEPPAASQIAMAALTSRPLAEVQRRVSAVHHQRDLEQQLRFYNGWAKDYEQLQAKGFRHFHGLDGSQGMLEHAQHKGLYENLKLCLLGQETLPAPEGSYDATVIVGALSEGQVPSGVIPQLLLVTKPGGYVCLTTRSNSSNLRYKTELQQLLNDLEQQGLWEKVGMQEVEKWERATSHQQSDQDSEYISGVVYIYRKKIKSLV